MIVVDITYVGHNIWEIAEWLEENFGKTSSVSTPQLSGTNWKIHHTTISKIPPGHHKELPYIITRAEFKNENDALLFRLRWG